MNTCCFLGHRTIHITNELKYKLLETVEWLITDKAVDTFLFGSKSQFNTICHEIVSQAREKHPHIKRIYVRAEFPNISDSYKAYLLESYEDSYYPERIIGSGRAVYVERNFEIIDHSEFCIFYYCEDNLPSTRKSGSKIALDYARKHHKAVIIVTQ